MRSFNPTNNFDSNVLWVDWTTLSGDSNNPLVQQAADGYLDTTGYDKLGLRASITALTNATLYIMTAPSMDGPWLPITDFTDVGTMADMLWAEANAFDSQRAPLNRYLAWRIDASTGWQICFKLDIDVPEGQQSRLSGYQPAPPRRPSPLDVQPEWLNVRGGFSSAAELEVIQTADEWVDAAAYEQVTFRMQLLNATNATLALQAAMAEDGPWDPVVEFTDTTAATFVTLDRSQDAVVNDRVLQRFYRWGVQLGSSTDWELTFRINGVGR